MPVPVGEGAEAYGGGYKHYSPGEGVGATQKKGEHTGQTHGEELTKNECTRNTQVLHNAPYLSVYRNNIHTE